jgi:hypothetical protein
MSGNSPIADIKPPSRNVRSPPGGLRRKMPNFRLGLSDRPRVPCNPSIEVAFVVLVLAHQLVEIVEFLRQVVLYRNLLDVLPQPLTP